MKIGFTCHIIYDKGNVQEEPTITEALARLHRGELDVQLVQLWATEPYIILTVKK